MAGFVVALTLALTIALSGPAALALDTTGPAPGDPAVEGPVTSSPPSAEVLPTPPDVPAVPPVGPAVPGEPGSVVPAVGSSVVDGLLAPAGLAPSPAPEPGPSELAPILDLVAGRKSHPRQPAAKRPAANPGTGINPLAGLTVGSITAYGTGTAYHSDARLTGEKQPTNVEVGFAGAVYSSTAFGSAKDELARLVAPALKAGNSYGQGRGAEIEALKQAAEDNQIDLTNDASASAPPTKDTVTKERTDIDLKPLVQANLLRAQAAARSATSGCLIGPDLAYGLGSATDTNALATPTGGEPVLSTEGNDPPRSASQSTSRVRLLPMGGATPGLTLLSETRQTIAPTTILKGTPDEVTIEVAGEWALRALADGKKGSIAYGPDGENTDVPLLRVSRPEHPEKQGKDRGKNVLVAAVSADDLLGSDGLVVKVTDNAEMVIGEPPRMIGGATGSLPSTTGVLAAAAVDVARVRLFDQPEAQLRVGHMEVGAVVPPGGLDCPGIGMGLRPDLDSVRPGDRFTWTITVANTNDCLLDKVKVVDTIKASPGVRYKVVSTSPAAAKTSDSEVTFEGVRPLRGRDSTDLAVTVEVDPTSDPGKFTNEAVATGTCTPESTDSSAGTAAKTGIPVDGRVGLDAPDVSSVRVAAGGGGLQILGEVASLPSALARTGGAAGIVAAGALVAAGVLLRRFKPRRS